MADENTDKSVQNTSNEQNNHGLAAAVRAGTRVPDEPGKPKRRRRRRRRGRGNNASSNGKNSQIPDSVIQEQKEAQERADAQSQARLTSVSKELADEQSSGERGTNTDQQKNEHTKSQTQTANDDKSPATTLPALKVNGKEYRPQEQRDSGKKNQPKQKQGKNRPQPDSQARDRGSKVEETDKKVRSAFAGAESNQQDKKDKKAETQKTGDAASRTKTIFAGKREEGSSILAKALAEVEKEAQEEQKHEQVGEREVGQHESESAALKQALDQKEAKLDESDEKEKEKEKESDERGKQKERFTPRLQMTGNKAAAPTFSLQDIQRARRRRRIWSILVLLIIAAAGYFLWAGVQKARQSVSSTPDQTVAEKTDTEKNNDAATTSHEKATLSGHVNTSNVRFPSVTLNRVAIYVRYGGELGFRDTGIRLMEGETEWSFSQASYNEEYDIQAVLIDSGREIAYSNVAHAVAPTANIDLSFPAGTDTGAATPQRQVENVEPVLQLEESPTVSGLVHIEGNFPEGAQVVIWLGENTGEQTRQDAYTFAISSQDTAYTIGDLNSEVEYLMDAVLQTSSGQILGTAEQSLLARTPATDANFTIRMP